MNLAAGMARHSGRAAPSLHDAPHRQFKETTGRRSTYPALIALQTNRETSDFGAGVLCKWRLALDNCGLAARCETLIGYKGVLQIDFNFHSAKAGNRIPENALFGSGREIIVAYPRGPLGRLGWRRLCGAKGTATWLQSNFDPAVVSRSFWIDSAGYGASTWPSDVIRHRLTPGGHPRPARR